MYSEASLQGIPRIHSGEDVKAITVNPEALQSIVYIPSRLIEDQVAESVFRWPTWEETRAGDLVKVAFRSMVSVYYEMATQKMGVPLQDEFAHMYLEANSEFLADVGISEEIQKALYHRACRAWGTFVAEHQLYGLLVESGRYTCRKAVFDDVEGQADMIVKNGQGEFGLDIHTGSKASEAWRTIKARRHGVNEAEIRLPVLELRLLGEPYVKRITSKDRKARIHLFLPDVLSYIEKWRLDNGYPYLFAGRVVAS